MIRLRYAMKTDVGRVRKNNEDFFDAVVNEGSHFEKNGSLFLIADGLGGLEHGEIAAREAVAVVKSAFNHQRYFEGKDWLKKTIEEANEKIAGLNGMRSLDQNMATTLTVSVFYENRLIIGHVGDCRVYRIRDKKLERLTKDHTLDRYTLTQALGTTDEIQVDIYDNDVRDGDIYIQCSDGLYSMIEDSDFLNVVLENPSLDESCKQIVELANEKGGQDNISVQMVKVSEEETE